MKHKSAFSTISPDGSSENAQEQWGRKQSHHWQIDLWSKPRSSLIYEWELSEETSYPSIFPIAQHQHSG